MNINQFFNCEFDDFMMEFDTPLPGFFSKSGSPKVNNIDLPQNKYISNSVEVINYNRLNNGEKDQQISQHHDLLSQHPRKLSAIFDSPKKTKLSENASSLQRHEETKGDILSESIDCFSSCYSVPIRDGNNENINIDDLLRSDSRSSFTMSNIQKLIEDLELIEKPKHVKKLRKTRQQLYEKHIQQQMQIQIAKMSGQEPPLTDEERRHQKKYQKEVLKSEYLKSKQWSKQFQSELAQRLGLTQTQVYKWHYDMRKKENRKNKGQLQTISSHQIIKSNLEQNQNMNINGQSQLVSSEQSRDQALDEQ